MQKRSLLKAALLSAGLSSVLLVLSYVYWNLPYTYGYGDELIAKSSMVKDLTVRGDYNGEDVVAVNVAYDKVLAPHIGKQKDTLGVKAITDRRKLLSFLTMLKERDSYDYIMCDVRFDDYSTEYDDSLFSTIASMRDIVVASDDPAKAPEIIKDKAVKAAYNQRNIGDGFMKYEYLYRDGQPSIALRMWEDKTGGEIKKHWWGYSVNGKLCVKSIVPDFRYTIIDELSETSSPRPDNVNVYSSGVYYMGTQVVDLYEEGLVSGKFFDNKTVLIGDLNEYDIHTTIVGAQPGTIIIFNAYLALLNGDNVIPFWIYLLLFIVFWMESMFLFRNKIGIDLPNPRIFRRGRAIYYRKLSKKSRNNLSILMNLALVFFSYSTPLALLALFVYATCGIFVNAIIFGSVFFILSLFI